MRARRFPVVWIGEDDGEAAVGRLALRGDRVLLRGMREDRGPVRCSFRISEVESLLVTRPSHPTLHLRLAQQGWIRVVGFSALCVYELAQLLAQLP